MTKKLKVLIADDEEALTDLVEMMLQCEFDCEVTKATNGNKAIEALKANDNFSLIISDYAMPGSNGGEIYRFNNNHQKIPFFLLTGGELKDYVEFNNLKEANPLNSFFPKPFNTKEFLAAVQEIARTETSVKEYIKVNLAHYAKYSHSPAEVYIKLHDDKYVRIIHANEQTESRKNILDHYQQKGIKEIFLARDHYNQLLADIFQQFSQLALKENQEKALYKIAGFDFLVCAEGLIGIGLSETQIEKTNEIIDDTLNTLLNDPGSQKYIKELCEHDSYILGHSLLIMYVAAKICLGTRFDFNSVMLRICGAAFFHDFGLNEADHQYFEISPDEIPNNKIRNVILKHPVSTADYLPSDSELSGEIKKIIHEHHETPDGSGYPRKMTASQISHLSCLFILSEQIALCLLRNNFSKNRLQDFLDNIKGVYDQGNFSIFYQAARKAFSP